MSQYDADAFAAFEAAGWERQAASYEAGVGRVTSRVFDRLLDAADVRRGSAVLDVACGPGEISARAAARGAHVIGTDIAGAMIERARLAYPAIDFRQATAEDLPFRDGGFDCTVAGFLFLHLARPDKVASELARILASGGRAAATVWDAPGQNRYLGVVFDALEAAGATPPRDLPAGPPMFGFADEAVFARLLEDAGFSGVTVETVAFTERFSSADELWNGIMGGAVRLPPLVLAQPEPVQQAIRARVERLLDEHRAGDGFDVPVSVKLASGTNGR